MFFIGKGLGEPLLQGPLDMQLGKKKKKASPKLNYFYLLLLDGSTSEYFRVSLESKHRRG